MFRPAALLGNEIPEALTAAYYSNPQVQDYWTAYGHRGGLFNPRPARSKSSATGYNPFWGLFATASWRASRSTGTGLLEVPGDFLLLDELRKLMVKTTDFL